MKIIDFYYNVINFIKNIYDFRNFLYYNRFFDNHFIFYILREKLKVDIGYYKTKSYNLNVNDDIKKMKLCIKLLNRIIQDEYLERALRPYDKKYPDWLFNGIDKIPDLKLFRKCGDIADRQQKQDVDYLFKYMSKHIKSWWD